MIPTVTVNVHVDVALPVSQRELGERIQGLGCEAQEQLAAFDQLADPGGEPVQQPADETKAAEHDGDCFHAAMHHLADRIERRAARIARQRVIDGQEVNGRDVDWGYDLQQQAREVAGKMRWLANDPLK